MSVTRTSASGQQVLQRSSSQQAHGTETHEHHASANASAGLNLNLFGALSGAFSSKSQKSTHHNADGSSDTTETKHNQGAANAAASGTGSVYGAARAEQHDLHGKTQGSRVEAAQGKAVQGRKEKRVDHLGIEG
ncbi:palmitoyltransferase swf1 [Coniothyrium glycines]